MKLVSTDGHVTVELICLDGKDQLKVKTHGFYEGCADTVDELVGRLDRLGVNLADMQEV